MELLIKAVVIFLFILILISLGSAMVSLVKGQDSTKNRTAKALTYRIVISIILFLFLLGAYFTGLIQPHGLGG